MKRWKSLSWYCGELGVPKINISTIEPWSANLSYKMSWIEPNFPDNADEDDDAQWEREINEALEAIDALRDLDLDLVEETTMEEVPIAEEIPSQSN